MDKINVLLIAGQSNALGISHFAELPAEKQKTYDVEIYFNTNTENENNGVWQRVRPGLGQKPDRFGLELPAAHVLAARGERWVIIKYASDGTALYDRWNKARSAEDYNALIGTIRTAVRDLREKEREPVFRGLLWQQGCSDAIKEHTAAEYEQNLRAFVQNIRAETVADLPVAIGSVHEFSERMPHRATVIAAQKKVAAELSKVVFVPTTDIEKMFDGWHYTPACEWELGHRLTEAVLKL
jgi:hypothetical protein